MIHRIRPVGGIGPISDLRLLNRSPSSAPQLREGNSQAGSLESVRLTGSCPRRRIRLIIASDLSGSMGRFTEARDRALHRLIRWVPGNLRLDDELALLTFGSYTVVNTAPTTIRAFRETLTRESNPLPLVATGAVSPGIENATKFSPLVDAIRRLPSSRQQTALMLLSDGLFGDFPSDINDARSALDDAGISQAFLIRPSECGLEPGQVDPWTSLCSAPPMIADGADSDVTALSFGKVLAIITGQRLEIRG